MPRFLLSSIKLNTKSYQIYFCKVIHLTTCLQLALSNMTSPVLQVPQMPLLKLWNLTAILQSSLIAHFFKNQAYQSFRMSSLLLLLSCSHCYNTGFFLNCLSSLSLKLSFLLLPELIFLKLCVHSLLWLKVFSGSQLLKKIKVQISMQTKIFCNDRAQKGKFNMYTQLKWNSNIFLK